MGKYNPFPLGCGNLEKEGFSFLHNPIVQTFIDPAMGTAHANDFEGIHWFGFHLPEPVPMQNKRIIQSPIGSPRGTGAVPVGCIEDVKP